MGGGEGDARNLKEVDLIFVFGKKEFVFGWHPPPPGDLPTRKRKYLVVVWN